MKRIICLKELKKILRAKICLKVVLMMKSPECKCVKGPIKRDITLHKKNNYNQTTDENSNNLSTTLINNCETSENNVSTTTETPNNNDVINDDLAAPTWKKKFPINTTPFKLGSTETEFNKRKKSSSIINTPVINKAVEGFSSKPSGVDFDGVIDKPSKQESPRNSKTKN